MNQDVTIRFSGDSSGLDAAAKNAVNALKQVSAAAEGVTKKMAGGMGSQLEKALPNQKSLERVSRQLKQIANDAGVSVDQMTKSFLELQSSKGIGGAIKELKNLNNQAKVSGKTFAQSFEQSKKAAEDAKKRVEEINSAIVKLGVVGGAASAAIGGLFQQGLGRFLAFEGAIKQTGVITSASTEDVDALRDEVERLGVATSKSPAQIAQTTVSLSRAGFSARETTEALNGIVKASEATGESLELVGDITSKTIRAFSLGAEDSNRVADLLTTTANTTNTTVASLGESLNFVSAVAAGANQPLEEVLIAVGLLGDAGIQGSAAGTNLAAALERLKVASAAGSSEFGNLSKGSATAAKALAAIGGEVRNAEGQLKPLSEIIPILQANLANLSQADQDILFKSLFGVQGGRAFQTLLNATPERIALVTDSIKNAEGAANTAGTAMLQGLGGAFQLLSGSTETVAVKFGKFASVGLEPLVRAANQVLVTFLQLPGPIQNVLIATTGFVGVLGAASAALAAYNALNLKKQATDVANAAVLITTTAAEKAKTAAIVAGNVATTVNTALNKQYTITEVAAAAAKTATAAAAKAKATAVGLATAATGKQATANLAAAKSGAVFAGQLALVAAAVGALAAAYNSAREFGTEFEDGADDLRKSINKLADESKRAKEIADEALAPDEGQTPEITNRFERLIPKLTEKRLNDVRVNVREFRGEVGKTADFIRNLDNDDADIGLKAFETAIASVDEQLANLDQKELGTDVYNELRTELEASKNELNQLAAAKGLIADASETVAERQEREKESLKEQTEALEEQIEVLKEKAETEEIGREQQFEDERIDREDANEEEKIKRDRQNQEEKLARDRAFQDEIEKAELARDEELRRRAEQREDADRQRKIKQEQILEDLKDAAETEREQIKADAESRIEDLKESRLMERQSQEEEFSDRLESIRDQKQVDRDEKKREFDEQIESLKDARSEARRAAEQALAEQISQRLQEQSAAFSEAGEILSQQEKLAAAESEEERARLRAQFREEERRQDEIAALELANQVFSPDQLIDLAQDISGVDTPQNAEEAKLLQETLGQIEAEQKAQQAEADKAAQAALKEEQKAADLALQSEIEAKQLAFAESERKADIEHREMLQEMERAFKEEQRLLDLENQRAIEGIEDTRDAAIDASENTEEAAVSALEDQFTQEQIERDRLRNEADRLFKLETEQAIETAKQEFEDQERLKKQQFEDAERIKAQEFEAAEREKKRAFAAAERELDRQLALEIEQIEERIAALKDGGSGGGTEAPITEVEPRFKGGPVVPGKTYLGGEIRPEPISFANGKTAMVGLNGPELFKVPVSGMVHPSVQQFASVQGLTPHVGNSIQSSELLREVQLMREEMRRSPKTIGSDTYNIVGVKDPRSAALDFQRNRLKTKLRVGRL